MPRLSTPLAEDRRRHLERLARKARAADAALRQAIVVEREAGVSLRAIAEAVGLTHEGVAKIARQAKSQGPD